MAYPSPASDPSRALTLTATNLHWLGTDVEADWDQCAHGTATCAIGRIAVTALDCNLTAASLFLLRTLEHDHTSVASVAPSNRLFPHCGHAPWAFTGERFPTVNLGCDIGEDVWIHHTGGMVELAWGEFGERVRIAQWQEAVVTFADQVRAFYDASPPRRRSRGGDHDARDNEGWDAFWAEWVSRRMRANPSSPASRPAFTEGATSGF